MIIISIQEYASNGKGTANALLKDSTLVKKIKASLDNIQKGTEGFNPNMEALKRNFLFKGYFRRLEKQHKKKKQSSGVSRICYLIIVSAAIDKRHSLVTGLELFSSPLIKK